MEETDNGDLDGEEFFDGGQGVGGLVGPRRGGLGRCGFEGASGAGAQVAGPEVVGQIGRPSQSEGDVGGDRDDAGGARLLAAVAVDFGPQRRGEELFAGLNEQGDTSNPTSPSTRRRKLASSIWEKNANRPRENSPPTTKLCLPSSRK